VTRVEFFHGGTLIGADATPPSPFGVTWSTDPVAAGHYTLTARARDAAGNVGTSSGVPVTVDRAPTASAGPPQAVEATSPTGATVTLTGTGTDPDPGDTLSYLWTEGNSVRGTTSSLTLSVTTGVHVFTLRVTDSYGASALATVAVTVEDTRAPVLTLPADQTLPATSPGGAVVTFVASALDVVSGPVEVACAPASGSPFPVGATTVACAAKDDAGNVASGSFTVTVNAALPVLTLRINGQHPTPPLVTVAGPTRLTLDVSPGSYGASVDWYWALHYDGVLYWVTSVGLSTTPGPWLSAPPIVLSNVTLLDVTLPPAKQLTSVVFMMNGTTTVAADYITAARP
jgi:hypothetical protein